MEALVRWRHPQRGLIMPDDFLHLAEEQGYLTFIDELVLRHACFDAVEIMQRTGKSIRVNVNISPHGLLSGRLLDIAQTSLRDSGLPAGALELEITEHSRIADERGARLIVSALGSVGVGIAIDDFGTGYNSLSWLKYSALTTLKIDRSFVSDLETDMHSKAICLNVLRTAADLNLRAVAEGVEGEAQAGHLARWGCNELQGDLFGRAIPKGEFVEKLAHDIPLPSSVETVALAQVAAHPPPRDHAGRVFDAA